MWHSRALAVAAVAAALVTGAGCVTRSTYDRDLTIERDRTEAERLKTAALQEKLGQANKDVTKAWDTLAQKAADYTANQKAADDARRQVAGLKQQIERLQNSLKDAEKNAKEAADKAEKASKAEAEQMKKLQDQFDAAQKENAALRELAERYKARLEKQSSVPAAPVHSTPMTPTTSAPAPAGQ